MRKQKPAASALTLAFPNYPVGRVPYYKNRFLPYALRMGVGMDHGPEAMLLLMIIVLTEDKVRYRKSVRFWNDQLCAYIGCKEDKLRRVRDALVQSGWLSYSQGRKSVSGIYWVTVPGGDEQLDDSVLGDNFAASQETVTEFVPAGSGYNAGQKPGESRLQTGRKPGHSYLDPKPDPLPEWAAAERLVEQVGLDRYAEAVRASREHGLRPSDVQTLVTWWQGHSQGFQRPLGALNHALKSARPQTISTIESCFPPLSSEFKSRLAASVREASESARREAARLAEASQASVLRSGKQLELDFESKYGTELDELSESDLVKLCASMPAVVLERAKKDRRSPLIRLPLLKALANERSQNV